jgi:hypothetical protein
LIEVVNQFKEKEFFPHINIIIDLVDNLPEVCYLKDNSDNYVISKIFEMFEIRLLSQFLLDDINNKWDGSSNKNILNDCINNEITLSYKNNNNMKTYPFLFSYRLCENNCNQSNYVLHKFENIAVQNKVEFIVSANDVVTSIIVKEIFGIDYKEMANYINLLKSYVKEEDSTFSDFLIFLTKNHKSDIIPKICKRLRSYENDNEVRIINIGS